MRGLPGRHAIVRRSDGTVSGGLYDPAIDGNPGKVVLELPRTAGLGRYAAAALGLRCVSQRARRGARGAAAPGALSRAHLGDEHHSHRTCPGGHRDGLLGWRPSGGSDPTRHVLGPLLAVSGVSVAATPSAVRGAGVISDSLLMTTARLAIVVPGALLAAVTPMVTQLRLRSLSETGTWLGW